MSRTALAVLALALAGVGLSARAEPIPYVADDPSTQTAQDPRAIVAMLRRGGAVGRLTLDELDQPYFIGRIAKTRMVAAFFGCNYAMNRCRRVLYGAELELGGASQIQLADWSAARHPCGADILGPGRAWVWRSARLYAQDDAATAMAEEQAWLECVADFRRLAGEREP